MRLLTVSFLVSVLLACGRFTVDDGRSDVVGQVIDPRGTPVAGVRVMLIRDRRPIAETTSATDGRFRLEGTPGPAAVFGLQSSSSDQGVWRPDLELLPTGQTEVGQLELETVWAHPDVLWLRGAGFDEQLTRPEDDLYYLWGGGPSELLLATRTRKSGYEVVRVADDGTPTVLGSGPGLDLNNLPASGVPALPDGGVPLFYLPGTDVHGATVVVQQAGGYSSVTAAGARTIPIVRLTWLDALTGQTVLDVPVPNPEASSVNVVPGRGALIASGGQVLFASLERRATFSLPPDSFGGLLATSRGLFVAHESSTEVWLSRLDDEGRLTSGRRIARPEGLSNGAVAVDDRVVRVSRTNDSLMVVRFDPDTFEPRLETLAIGGEDPELGPSRGGRWVSSCSRAKQALTTFEESFDHGLRLTHVGALTSVQRQWRIGTDVPLGNSWQGCSTPDGFWRVLRPLTGGVTLLRVRGAVVELTELPGDVAAVDQLGSWPVLVRLVDGRSVRTLLPPDASLDDPRVLSRVPFVLTTGTPSLDGRFVFTTGLSSDGHHSLFRVPAPFGAPR